jgi:hypothetical protein
MNSYDIKIFSPMGCRVDLPLLEGGANNYCSALQLLLRLSCRFSCVLCRELLESLPAPLLHMATSFKGAPN